MDRMARSTVCNPARRRVHVRRGPNDVTLPAPPAVDTGPLIVTADATLRWDTPGYRDALCQCLGQRVRQVRLENDQRVFLAFDNDSVVLMPVSPRGTDAYPGIIFYDTQRTYIW